VPGVSQILDAIPQSARLFNVQAPTDKSNVDFAQFWVVWKRLEDAYLDPTKLDAKKMVYGAIQGMVAALGDPYTMYLPPEEQKRTAEDLQGSFDGVGIELGFKNQTLAVVAPLKDHPAAKAGVKAGDLILHLKDEAKGINKDTTGMSLPEAVDIIRGQKGTTITMTFLREGGKPEEKVLTRDTISVPSVELNWVNKGNKKVAHIVLSRFGEKTVDEWSVLVTQILADKKNVAGVVLDMRNNPGGYLQDAIDIASDFIPNGTIVTQQGRTQSQTYEVNRPGRLLDIPVVVLVNRGSASASEIVAGALRDRRNAKLVGENTFGKGTVQDAQSDLPNGAGIHITIARWLLPSGEWIHEKGLPADVAANDNPDTNEDEALQAAVDAL
jgi:carboxyl-terminal processing protease